jgi:hypothetical protein
MNNPTAGSQELPGIGFLGFRAKGFFEPGMIRIQEALI